MPNTLFMEFIHVNYLSSISKEFDSQYE